ncbi:DNA polymerase IV [Alkalicoccus urumqiensis]|uniref:DNA polymerase IV n=1 Tax=Alkalicoccus urumqiensis TaxID=1548213 RepID=A0A2P6MEV7_ALKUR|nr:DNA polymerase IV [Alkalicoccus urumqiensis]PRO64804.1 DNA polymerase IV [Alkalicoccus urumqiensis]
MEHPIMLIDMQSFFASVERLYHEIPSHRALIVSGAPDRPSGVVLAVCPRAKSRGIQNGMRLHEAVERCPEAAIVPPRMQRYLETSLHITSILEKWTNLVEPYSIDEQFVDLRASIFPSLQENPSASARGIQQNIFEETGLHARVGIAASKTAAKTACDLFAKQAPGGIFLLSEEKIKQEVWPLPVDKLFRAGKKMTVHLRNRGLQTIGEFASLSHLEVRRRWGIHGQVLWMNAHGVDYSPVQKHSAHGKRSIGSGMTLPRLYSHPRELRTVLLELTEEVGFRSRRRGLRGSTVTLGLQGPSCGFHRQRKLSAPTANTSLLFEEVLELLDEFWDLSPVQRVHISLSSLETDLDFALHLFEPPEKQLQRRELDFVLDALREQYGKTALLRGSSAGAGSQALDRAKKLGGHLR